MGSQVYNSTKKRFQYTILRKRFPDAESARLYLERRHWKGKPVCPGCGGVDRQYEQTRGNAAGCYNCHHCKLVYTVRTNSIFERSRVPLNKWFFTFYLVATVRNGISSLELSRVLGVTQKTAWFMLHRIRESCKDDNTRLLRDIVEADETYVGGKARNKREKSDSGRGPVDMIPVLGVRQRGGRFKGIVLWIQYEQDHWYNR